MRPKTFWPAPPTSCPVQKLPKMGVHNCIWLSHISLESPWKEDFKNSKKDKILPTPPTSCPTQKLILDSKMNKNGCSLKYGCFIYCWKTHGKEISRSPNKFWPAPPKNQSWILHQFILEKLFNTWVTQQICLNRPANLCKLPWLQAYTSLWSWDLNKITSQLYLNHT